MPVAELSVDVSLERILVATDFSECSEQALLASLRIAQRYGSKLRVVHVVPREGYAVTGVGMFGAMNFARHGARDLESELLRKGCLEGIRYRISVEEGEVWPVVSRMVEEEGIDLVVVGTHGRSGLGKMLMGSVAEKIFRQARCPVLTLGPNVQPSSPLTAQSRSILFPTDFSPQAEHAFPYAFSLAQEQQAHLIFLHVAQRAGSEATCNKDWAVRYTSARLLELMSRAAGLAREPEFMVETGDAAEAIVRVATGRRAEVVVLGVRGPARLSDRIGWSTAYGVVRQAPCPVLTVRGSEPLEGGRCDLT